ncbi:hypothetical protein ADK38_24010, partial [Streptomyces varsoviensis]
LTQRFPAASAALASVAGAAVMVGDTPTRGAIARKSAASSFSHPYTVIPVVAAAVGREDASDGVRRATAGADSL